MDLILNRYRLRVIYKHFTYLSNTLFTKDIPFFFLSYFFIFLIFFLFYFLPSLSPSFLIWEPLEYIVEECNLTPLTIRIKSRRRTGITEILFFFLLLLLTGLSQSSVTTVKTRRYHGSRNLLREETKLFPCSGLREIVR